MNAMDAASSSRAAGFPGEDYDYLRLGFLVTVGSCLFRCFVLTVLWLYFFFVNGVRVHGFRNARRLRKTGYVAICNHVNKMDSPLASEAIGLRRSYYVTLTENLQLPVAGPLVRALGGVPLGSSPAQLGRLMENMHEALRAGKVVMVFPEGNLVPYCRELQPFRRGGFLMAAEAGVPVLPMRVTYREPKGLWKRLRRRPFLTLNVLPPIWPDRTLAPRAQSLALMAACREAMERVG